MKLYLINILEKNVKLNFHGTCLYVFMLGFYVIFFALLQMSTQNGSPAHIVAGNVFLFVKFHVHGPKSFGPGGRNF